MQVQLRGTRVLEHLMCPLNFLMGAMYQEQILTSAEVLLVFQYVLPRYAPADQPSQQPAAGGSDGCALDASQQSRRQWTGLRPLWQYRPR
jgi:hypothetical protein